jgi:hypothetical protein
MQNSQLEMKKAVDSGYWHLFRYNPDLIKENKNPFVLDSPEPKLDYLDFLNSESRYTALLRADEEKAKELFDEAKEFARLKYDVSVQYGANQPEYDLIAVSGDKILKISVKGSKDKSWGLTQGYKKGCTYHEAVDRWLDAHHEKTIFSLVQFYI